MYSTKQAGKQGKRANAQKSISAFTLFSRLFRFVNKHMRLNIR